MSSIVIGYDGSPQSDDALALGRILADVTAARPVVTAVATWPSYLWASKTVDDLVHAELDPVLESAAGRLDGLHPKLHAAHARSVPAELMATAEREEAAAIVIGSSRHSAIGRVALGSTGTSLIHGAPCAVTVAPRGLAEGGDPRFLNLGVAFDGSAEAWSALETGIGIAQRTHARLTIVTCADYPAYAFTAAWTVYSAGEIKDLEKDEKERVQALALKRVPDDLPVQSRILSGPPGRVISELSGEFDLLLLGSRGYGPFGRTFLGSVASHVIHSAHCPVMVLPRGAGSDPFGLDKADRKLREPA